MEKVEESHCVLCKKGGFLSNLIRCCFVFFCFGGFCDSGCFFWKLILEAIYFTFEREIVFSAIMDSHIVLF